MVAGVSIFKSEENTWDTYFAISSSILLLQFSVCGVVINCFSVYLPYLLEKCGLTNAESASILLVRNVFTILSLLVVGKVYDKLELRIGITCAVILGAASLMLFSVASSLRQLIIASAVTGLAYGFAFMLSRHVNLELEAGLTADLLTNTLCNYALVVHIDKLELKRGATCINNQNLHFVFPSDLC